MMMQTKKPAANPLMEIAERIREMREIVVHTVGREHFRKLPKFFLDNCILFRYDS